MRGLRAVGLDPQPADVQVGHCVLRGGGGFMPNVSLTPEQQRFIESRVASGRFGSANEVMRHALRLMQEAEERRA